MMTDLSRSIAKLARTALELAQSAEGSSRIFEVDYYPWRPIDVTRVILLRHKNGYNDPDDFTCHDAETGENLGWGADKEEATFNACYKLSNRAQVLSPEFSY